MKHQSRDTLYSAVSVTASHKRRVLNKLSHDRWHFAFLQMMYQVEEVLKELRVSAKIWIM